MEFLYHSSNTDVSIRNRDDIPIICKACNDESKRNITYPENQLFNQDKQECSALKTFYNKEAAGRVFLYYKCRWDGLAECGIPSVVDLVVFEKFRQKGIAWQLQPTAFHGFSNPAI